MHPDGHINLQFFVSICHCARHHVGSTLLSVSDIHGDVFFATLALSVHPDVISSIVPQLVASMGGLLRWLEDEWDSWLVLGAPIHFG